MRVQAFDGLCSLYGRGERGLFRGLSALAGADARAHDGSTVAGADVAADAIPEPRAEPRAEQRADNCGAIAVADAPADARPQPRAVASPNADPCRFVGDA